MYTCLYSTYSHEQRKSYARAFSFEELDAVAVVHEIDTRNAETFTCVQRLLL